MDFFFFTFFILKVDAELDSADVGRNAERFDPPKDILLKPELAEPVSFPEGVIVGLFVIEEQE